MIVYYLDSSAWLKRYYQETGCEAVQELFQEIGTLACAAFGFIEVLATLARKDRACNTQPEVLAGLVKDVERDWQDFVQIPFDDQALSLTQTLAVRVALRGADTVHLASALLLQDRLRLGHHRLVFVTSDRELYDGAQRMGLTVVDPEQERIDRVP